MKFMDDGRAFILTTKDLREVRGSANSSVPYKVTFTDLKQAVEKYDSDVYVDYNYVTVHAVSVKAALKHGMMGRLTTARFSISGQRIGCKQFTQRNFNRILKAAGVRVPKIARG